MLNLLLIIYLVLFRGVKNKTSIIDNEDTNELPI